MDKSVLFRYNIDRGIRKLAISYTISKRNKLLAEELFQTIYEYRIINREYIKKYGENRYLNPQNSDYMRVSMEKALDRRYAAVRNLMSELQKSLRDNSITFLLTRGEYFLVSKTEIIYSKLIEDRNEDDNVI